MGRLSLSRKLNLLIVAISALLLVLCLWGCDNSESVNPGPVASAIAPVLSELEIPTFWVFGSEHARDLSVQLDLPESVREAVLSGTLEEPVVCLLVGEQPTNYLYLQDDGGSTPLDPTHDFVEEYSGDLIPNDFKYNLQINSNFATEEGSYNVRLYAGWFDPNNIEAASGETTTQVSETMTVEVNSPPVIESISLPDSLHAGFEPETWVVTVSDPDENAGDKVVNLSIHLTKDNLEIRQRLFTDFGNHEWTMSVDSTFSAAYETGDYDVELRAIDMFEQETIVDTLGFWIENSPPLLFNVVVPDTVILPLEGANVYTYYASAMDSQGLGDIEKVYFTLLRPDGEYRDNNGLGFSFGDDGIPPDDVADDGNFIYSFPLQRDPNNPPVLGTYTFYFYSLDRGGNLTGPITKEIVEIAETTETPR